MRRVALRRGMSPDDARSANNTVARPNCRRRLLLTCCRRRLPRPGTLRHLRLPGLPVVNHTHDRQHWEVPAHTMTSSSGRWQTGRDRVMGRPLAACPCCRMRYSRREAGYTNSRAFQNAVADNPTVSTHAGLTHHSGTASSSAPRSSPGPGPETPHNYTSCAVRGEVVITVGPEPHKQGQFA